MPSTRSRNRWAAARWLLALVGFMGGLAGPLPAGELESFREVAVAQDALYARQHLEQRQNLNEMYVGAISNQIQKATAAGDLQRVLRLREVVADFAENGPSVLGPPHVEDPEFARGQETWVRLDRDLQRQHGEKMLRLLQQFEEVLGQLQIRLTREGRIDEALLVQEERKKWAADSRKAEWETLVAETAPPESMETAAQAGPELPILSAYNATLVLYYSFDREDRGRILDRSRERNHGQASSLGWVAQGPRGGAASFDGAKSSIVIPNSKSLQSNASTTIAFWIRPSKLGARTNPVNKSYGGEYTLTVETNGDVNFYHGIAGRDAEPYQGVHMDKSLKVGEWTHLALVRDAAARKVIWYRNGQPVHSEASTYAEVKASDKPLRIGQGYAGSFPGELDELMIFQQALGPVDIQRIYRSVGGK